MSSSTAGDSHIGVDITLAGLSFQVFTLIIFICFAADYALRWSRGQRVARTSGGSAREPLTTQFLIFVAFLSLAILVILIRCVYRIDELSNGYSGPLIHDEGLFIGLEGV
jgi:hypothetical protein